MQNTSWKCMETNGPQDKNYWTHIMCWRMATSSGRVSSILATNVLLDLVLALLIFANLSCAFDTFLKTEDTAKNIVHNYSKSRKGHDKRDSFYKTVAHVAHICMTYLVQVRTSRNERCIKYMTLHNPMKCIPSVRPCRDLIRVTGPANCRFHPWVQRNGGSPT